MNKKETEQTQLTRQINSFSKKFNSFNKEGALFFFLIEHKQQINCVTNMNEWHLRTLREYVDNKVWEIKREDEDKNAIAK